LKQDGTVVTWGSIDYTVAAVVAIAAGFFHDLAIKQDGTVVAWG
jgi:alpha-tubulin suppressor-like RCC1 family protein